MSNTADEQAQKIASMHDYDQKRNAIIQMQQGSTSAGGGTRGDATKYFVNMKDVKIEDFYGDEAKFIDFVENTKTYTDVIMPELGEILEWLEYQPKNVTENAVLNRVGSSFVNFNRTLSGFMKVRLRGKA